MPLVQRLALITAAVFALTACGSTEGGPADPGGETPNPRIAVSVSAPSLSVQAGSNAAVTATITRSGGFTGPVTIGTTGAPTGVTATASDVATSGTTTTGTITVTVAASVAAGSYPLVVTASGSGVPSATAALSLVVTAAPPSPDFSLSATSPPAALQGASATVPVTIARTNFTGAVTLSATGVPTGVTATFAPQAPTGTSSTLTLAVGSTVPPGSYPVQIVGSGAPGTRSGTITLVVSVAGSYAILANPNAATVAPSGSVTSTVSVSPSGGFSGVVGLSVTGLPTGMSASFSPVSTSTTSTLTLVTSGAAPGASTLIITGQTSGLANVTTTLGVTVMPVSTNTTITLDYAACPADERVQWLAYRDGPTAPWTPVTGVADRFEFTLTGALGGLAVVTNSGVAVLLQTVGFLTDYAARPCDLPQPERTVSGIAAGLPANANGWMSYGTSAIEIRTASPDFLLDDAPLGPHDLLGYIRTGTGVGTNDRAFLRRDVNPAAPGNISNVDFSGPESFVPQFASVTVVGANGQALEHSMSYVTRVSGTSCDIATLYDQLPAVGATVPAYGVPANRQRTDDLHLLNVRASTTTGQTKVFQEALESFHTLSTRGLTLPAPFNPTVSRVTGAGHHRLRVQGTLPAELDGIIAVSTGAFSDLDYILFVAPAWLTGAMVDLVAPDLTGLSGFNPAWAPQSTEPLEYSVIALNQFSIGLLVQECAVNARVAGSGKEGVLPD